MLGKYEQSRDVRTFSIGSTSCNLMTGESCSPHSQPWMAALFYHLEHYCAGVLVHPQWVLSAAHCWKPSYTIVLGLHGIYDWYINGSQIIKASYSVKHPQYINPMNGSDLMLIKLNTSVVESDTIQTIPIASECPTLNSMCWVCGWGELLDGYFALDLQCAIVHVVAEQECRFMLDEHYHDSMFCAGGESRRNTCRLDSGGPLLCKGVLQGLVSMGTRPCGQLDYPSIYTNLCKFKEFGGYFTVVIGMGYGHCPSGDEAGSRDGSGQDGGGNGNGDGTEVEDEYYTTGLGLHGLSDWFEPGSQIMEASFSVQHPQYIRPKSGSDLMLIKLKKPVAISDTIGNLPITSRCPTRGTRCRISGWGQLLDGYYPFYRQCAVSPVVSEQHCRFKLNSSYHNSMFCAGGEGRKDSCRSDSGGPLDCVGVLQGFVFWGQPPCGQPGVPGFYTNLCKFKGWINEIIQTR
ncbi:PREDICTED: uncharacterized protein LOC102008580 [Chinchilla lanigera]|uniref:uncharacterized protein LOC102008580 n=1 Tax=Chinchilla lanigera TaxID=34839 RepID=UPI0006987ACA|nr:PREDICTED: uncharacterized protein LOC102008580 [Chinchilla lanigera]